MPIEDDVWRKVKLSLDIGNVVVFPAAVAYCIIYYLNLDFFERYKIDNKPWPWQLEKKEWSFLRNYLIKSLLVSHLITYPLLYWLHAKYLPDTYDFDMTAMPENKTILIHLLISLLSEDFFFYFTHKLFHQKPFY